MLRSEIMDGISPPTVPQVPPAVDLWCPSCARAVHDPLVCGDCSAVLCRICGTPLESADELAFGQTQAHPSTRMEKSARPTTAAGQRTLASRRPGCDAAPGGTLRIRHPL